MAYVVWRVLMKKYSKVRLGIQRNPQIMPATNAERRRKFIDNLKQIGSYAEFKKKKAEHEKARRQRLKDSIAKLSESKRMQVLNKSRLQCRERAKKFRDKKKEVFKTPRDTEQPNISSCESSKLDLPKCTSVNVNHSYKTYGALAKAVTKTRRTLPSSPSKRNAVLSKIVHSLDDEAKQEVIRNKTTLKRGGNRGTSPAIIQKIQSFYQRDDISRMSPNVKDTRYFLNPTTGQKELMQIRHLVVTLKEAHDLFLKENAGEKTVKLAKFCSLRPAHVKLCGCMPNNVCVCIYHANFIEACTVLHKHVQEFPAYGTELTQLLVCCEFNRDCWFKTCADCSPTIVEQKLREIVAGKNNVKVTWLQWKQDKVKKRTQRDPEHGTITQLLNYFISIYRDFLKHSYTKNEQSDEFNIDREYINSETNVKECLVQVDFAENFKCEAQDEAVNAHWNQHQISLFTVAIHYRGRLQSRVIASDNTDHSKDTLVPYLYTILSRLPKAVKIVRLWSDGPNSQFKNKYIAAVIGLFEKMFKIKLIWNYFPTAHGKGCIDGLGAVVKSKVKRLVKLRRKIVNNAKQFVEAFNSEKSSVETMEVTTEEIQKIYAKLKLEDVFQGAPAVKNISKCHQLQSVNNIVTGFLTSKDGYAFNQTF